MIKDSFLAWWEQDSGWNHVTRSEYKELARIAWNAAIEESLNHLVLASDLETAVHRISKLKYKELS